MYLSCTSAGETAHHEAQGAGELAPLFWWPSTVVAACLGPGGGAPGRGWLLLLAGLLAGSATNQLLVQSDTRSKRHAGPKRHTGARLRQPSCRNRALWSYGGVRSR
jgi:hypothetical protein